MVVGVVALVPCIIGALFSTEQFFRAYLTAYVFYLGIPLGCLVILMIYHLTGGAWGFLIQRILEAGTRTLPLFVVLFLPVAFGVEKIYLWAQPGAVAADHDIQHKQMYLNTTFFYVRAAVYFVTWIVLAFLLSNWSARHDQTGEPSWLKRQGKLSGPGLVLFGITITFAAVDWVMSLQPSFRSTIFGPLVAGGQILSGQAFVLIVLAWLAPRSRIGEVLSPSALNDLGNLLFTFLVIWAYLTWFQFMLIWIANLPYEVGWILPRSHNGWQWVAWALGIFQFAIPFFLLLMRDVKQHLGTLARVAALILVMQLVNTYYLVMPSFPATHLGQHWMDFLTPIALGGFWLAYFLYELKRRPLLARSAEDQAEAAHLRHVDAEAASRPQEMGHA